MLNDLLERKLHERESKGLLRKLVIPRDGLVDFTSNDYLGLATNQDLHQAIAAKANAPGIFGNGSGGSRLLSGNSSYALQVEDKLATLFSAGSALLLNSGYAANLAALSALPQRNDTILYDELSHACIKDGARLSPAKRMSFRHNDLNDLERKLKDASGNIFIAVESLYSMDGDQCPLPELVGLAENYDATIILDEAHSTGVYGNGGSGLAASLGLEDRIGVRIYTFGKAMGIHGACIVGTALLKQYLVNFARPFIYTTAPPPHFLASVECAFDYLGQHTELQPGLRNNIQTYVNNIGAVRSSTQSAIQSIVTPGNENAKQVADNLQRKGYDVRPILSPTVAEGKERIRICIHAFNTTEQINGLTRELRSMLKKD